MSLTDEQIARANDLAGRLRLEIGATEPMLGELAALLEEANGQCHECGWVYQLSQILYPKPID